MIPIIKMLEDECQTAGEFRARIDAILELDKPLSDRLFERICSDARFAQSMFRARRHPRLMAQLMRENNERTITNSAVISGATRSLSKWAASGFQRVPESIFDQRMDVCERCEHFVTAPNRLLYKICLSRRSDPRICDMCGCVVAMKARLPNEKCPKDKW